jgi:hypothetical protein
LKLSISSKNMLKSLDPFWVYGIPEDGTNQKRLNWKLCGLNMSGGICRLKYHLAKIFGHDVGVFSNTYPEIMRIAFDSLQAKDKRKNEVVAKKVELIVRSSATSTPEEQCSGRGSTYSSIRRSTYFFVPRTTTRAQPSIK